MSDRASSSEGAQSPSRHRSPPTDDPQYHFDSLQEKEVGVAASGPHTRRRPSRTTSGTKGSPLSASPPYPYSEEQDEDDRKTKPPRNTLKKLLRRDSHHADTVPAPRGGQEELEEEESNVGYIPRLGQIREKKTTMQSRRRGSSIVSSTGQPKALRRRHTEDSAAGRSRVRRKPSSLHRHGGKLAELSEPSSASSVSQQSGTSSGSNSTVTQQAREDHGYTYQYQIPGERHSPASSMMNVGDSEVFKYLQPDYDTENSTPAYPQAIAPSIDASPFSSSPPLGDSSLGDKRSSVVTDSQDANGSKATSPSLAQQSNPTESQLPHQEFRKFKKPLYASSFVHGPRDEDEETVNQSGESEGSCTESAEESEHSNEFNKATTKAPPPRAPSTSSRGSDPHARRLKQQERELANHILKNPKPQKGFQFNAGTPAPVYPPMPMYSPQVYSATSPSAVSPAVNSPQGWPPMHSFPAPLAIGYAPHQSPEAVHAYPHSVVKQMPPPFSPHPMQPPHYQQQAPSSNQTKPSLTGYELLANELSAPSQSDTAREKNIVPMYRKFEHLNHRVLLHLQDEMCELEEELRQLDRCIAQMSPKDPSGYAYPASRRNDARYGGDLHFKRTELLGRIFQKLEQYNKALSSFSDVSRNLGRARAEDVQSYREWMGEHKPIDSAEARFLERDSDLVAISRQAPITAAKGAGHDYSAAVWFPLILVLPLMAFAIVPTLLGRLVVIVLIVGVELKMVSSAPELRRLLSVQEWTAAVSV